VLVTGWCSAVRAHGCPRASVLCLLRCGVVNEHVAVEIWATLSAGGGSRTPRKRFWRPLRFRKLADSPNLGTRIEKAARIGFPMGGSLTTTVLTSWWGAYAAQRLMLFLPEVGAGRTHGNDRGAEAMTLRPSLPHVRHDSPSLGCASIIADADT